MTQPNQGYDNTGGYGQSANPYGQPNVAGNRRTASRIRMTRVTSTAKATRTASPTPIRVGGTHSLASRAMTANPAGACSRNRRNVRHGARAWGGSS